ncbi:PCNA-associated factor-like [Euwallacea similis]|uniref:PCNA-associated factor-like n=1 Tax=Euwallacea similis TaxID=1736056 RepID=UPI00344E06AC
MVRTGAAGIRVSSGRSSKKVGGASTSATPKATKSGGSSSWKLPPIPHTETPQWQKPITNFFKLNSPLKEQENDNEEKHETDFKDNAEEPDKKKRRIEGDEGANEIIKEEKENVVAGKVEEPTACSSSHIDARP